MNNLIFDNGVSFLNKLKMIFYMLIGIPLIAFIFLFLKYREGIEVGSTPEFYETLKIIVSVICILLSSIAYLLYGVLLKNARKEKKLRLKLQNLFNANILKFALLESGTIIVLIAFYLTGHMLFAAVYVMMLILFGISNPSIYTILNDLKLPKKEANIVMSNQPIE